MRIALGNDHAGYPLKSHVRSVLERLGHEVIDCGAPSEEPVDFPDITFDTCDVVRRGEADRDRIGGGVFTGPPTSQSADVALWRWTIAATFVSS